MATKRTPARPKTKVELAREANLKTIDAALRTAYPDKTSAFRVEMRNDMLMRSFVDASSIDGMDLLVVKEDTKIPRDADRVVRAQVMAEVYRLQYEGWLTVIHNRFGWDVRRAVEAAVTDWRSHRRRIELPPDSLLDDPGEESDGEVRGAVTGDGSA